jgi:hypothetical protein
MPAALLPYIQAARAAARSGQLGFDAVVTADAIPPVLGTGEGQSPPVSSCSSAID